MGKEEELSLAKRSYRRSKEEGNRQEEARWANVVGDILKNRGEYVEALKWLRIDYEISVKYLPEKQLLPTCQSLGELYLRLRHYKDALIYQKKHLELAKDAGDLVEQQRASTQLGRTYHEMLLNSDDDHYSVRNAKKYFKAAMELARSLKDKNSGNSCSYLKEFVDAHNNIGMLEKDLDNFEEAKRFLVKGLAICDEEEVDENDDSRSRLHHNLGSVYMELRIWDKAMQHIEKDILICKKIAHIQGEAKGYINLGELHYRVQRYDNALLSYKMALDRAKSLEDEDALVDQIDENIETVKQATNVLDEIKKEEQSLKKLTRNMSTVRGTARERKLLLQQIALLDRLIEKSSTIFAWLKHREFAKRKKRIAKQLCDKEKLSDSFLTLGESYQQLRKFKKAMKWFSKSWGTYKSIGNMEGQALAKINIGDSLDSEGDWVGAFHAFEEGYRLAVEANRPAIQLSALENMHYSNMMRFDDIEEARKLQLEIDKLKQSEGNGHPIIPQDCCSETDTEGDDLISNSRSSTSCTPTIRKVTSSPKSLEHSGRKRLRLVLSDDENEVQDVSQEKHYECLEDDVGQKGTTPLQFEGCLQMPNGSISCCDRANVDESSASHKSSKQGSVPANVIGSSSNDFQSDIAISDCKRVGNPFEKITVGGKMTSINHDNDRSDTEHFTFKIDNQLLHVPASRDLAFYELNEESIKAELACMYYLRLPAEKRYKGLLPIIQEMTCAGRCLDYVELPRSTPIDVSFVWVQKRLIKSYVDFCEELREPPNLKLLKKLYLSEVEDVVNCSDSELQDISIIPLLNALHTHNTIAILDLSHNLLGNTTIEKLQELFTSGMQYGGLTLDLHCNRFGSTALFQICECPVLFTRLEVLNISGNRLTDTCGSFLSTILIKCRALVSLNIERCSVTSRTIQKVADALTTDMVLSQLFIGDNNPVSGTSIVNLTEKLTSLKRFTELSLTNIKLNKAVVESLCKFINQACMSSLMLGGTFVGTDGALQLTKSILFGSQEPVKFNFSHCALRFTYIEKISRDSNLIGSLVELNLEKNSFQPEGANELALMLSNPRCVLKTLVLNQCQLEFSGILQIIQALQENNQLEEIHLAGNCGPREKQHQSQTGPDPPDVVVITTQASELHRLGKPDCLVDKESTQLDVPDSEDDAYDAKAPPLELEGSSTTSTPKNPASDHKLLELSTAISCAKRLGFLDLSNNGFSSDEATFLYTAWSSESSRTPALRHLNGDIVHFSTPSNKCCRGRPCCRKD